MGFFDDLKAAAIEKVKEKVKEELAELGIDLDDEDDDADAEPEPEEIIAEGSPPPVEEDVPLEEEDERERPVVSAWSTPLNITTPSPSQDIAPSNNPPPSSSVSSSFPYPNADTTFNEAVQKLWDLDARLTPNKDYKIDVQRSKPPCNKQDAAEEPLFTYVKPAVFRNRPTFTTFVALLNNYSACTGETEDVTEEELQENRAFLNEIMKTKPMKYCHQYCIAKGLTYKGKEISRSTSEFKQILNSIWFELYSRSGRRNNKDSSGFEHVFVGEVKNGQISGFHNWIMFYLEEKRGNIDFRGYIKPKCRDYTTAAETNDDDPVLTLQFKWNGVEKFVGTSFIGVTPEFEMALYTMAFLACEDDENIITLDAGCEKFDLNVKCHKYDRNTKVGSCYVEALAHYE